MSSNIGIVINQNGELENLCKTVEARKGEWLAGVLSKDLTRDPELEPARIMAQDLMDKAARMAGFGLYEATQ